MHTAKELHELAEQIELGNALAKDDAVAALRAYAVLLASVEDTKPVAWVHPICLEGNALGIECSSVQLGPSQVPLFLHPPLPVIEDGEEIVQEAIGTAAFLRHQGMQTLAGTIDRTAALIVSQRAELERVKGLLQSIADEIDDDKRQAPGHCHDRPGIWNTDNGDKAGKPCDWCLLWREIRSVLRAAHPKDAP